MHVEGTGVKARARTIPPRVGRAKKVRANSSDTHCRIFATRQLKVRCTIIRIYIYTLCRRGTAQSQSTHVSAFRATTRLLREEPLRCLARFAPLFFIFFFLSCIDSIGRKFSLCMCNVEKGRFCGSELWQLDRITSDTLHALLFNFGKLLGVGPGNEVLCNGTLSPREMDLSFMLRTILIGIRRVYTWDASMGYLIFTLRN